MRNPVDVFGGGVGREECLRVQFPKDIECESPKEDHVSPSSLDLEFLLVIIDVVLVIL
jgi:hypothetical protein